LSFETTRLTRTFASLILAGLVAGADARADLVITIDQQGSNVVESGSGAIDLTGLTINQDLSSPTNLDPSDGLAITGTSGVPLSLYTGLIENPAAFGH